MAAVTILARSAKAPVPVQRDGNLHVKKFHFHIASVANGGAALEQLSIVRLAKLPKGAMIYDLTAVWEAGGGTNTLAFRRCATSDGTTHTDIITNLTGGSAGYFRLAAETEAAETLPIPLAVESWIDVEMAGANGWPVDKYIQGMILYFFPSSDDEVDDLTGDAADDLGV